MNYVVFDKLCKQKGTTPTALSRKLGLSKGNTSSWKKGGNPSVDILIRIADELDCTVDLLLGREKNSSSINLSDDEFELLTYFKNLKEREKGIIIGEAKAFSRVAKTVFEEPKNTFFIETYSLPVSAGTGVYLDNCEREMIRVQETALTHEANFALRVSGDSMEPDYHDGDILLIRSQPTVELGEIGIFILDGEGYVKEFGGDCLISHNPKYKNIKLEKYSEIYCRGLVIGVLDDGDFV